MVQTVLDDQQFFDGRGVGREQSLGGESQSGRKAGQSSQFKKPPDRGFRYAASAEGGEAGPAEFFTASFASPL